MTTKIINVAGMSCEHCKMAVTRAVSALEGVKAVEVSLENNTATVEFEETKLGLDTIRQVIEAQGYEVVQGISPRV
jgi:copper chaperone